MWARSSGRPPSWDLGPTGPGTGLAARDLRHPGGCTRGLRHAGGRTWTSATPAAVPGTSVIPAGVADRTSLVSVCRSTVMYRRQPVRWYQVSLVQPHGLARRYR